MLLKSLIYCEPGFEHMSLWGAFYIPTIIYREEKQSRHEMISPASPIRVCRQTGLSCLNFTVQFLQVTIRFLGGDICIHRGSEAFSRPIMKLFFPGGWAASLVSLIQCQNLFFLLNWCLRVSMYVWGPHCSSHICSRSTIYYISLSDMHVSLCLSSSICKVTEYSSIK